MAVICLVSPSHLANNPRLVKEAGALHAAGHDVRVVCGRYYAPIDPFDAEIRDASPWHVTTVDYGRGWRDLPARLLHKLARRRIARSASPSLSLALLAQHRAHHALASAASRVPASLFIGHTAAGLGAAAVAARRRGVPYAFDAEDFHPAETEASETDPAERASIATIERTLLPGAALVTAASPLIGRAYVQRYDIRPPVTVLNVFPLDEAPPPPAPAASATRRLYWFSQTIGPGRGLEEILAVLALLRTPTSLHLRGLPSPGFPESLRKSAASAGYRGEIEFLSIGTASEMARLAAPYDLGLSLEQRTPLNRDLCLTNKIFTYLLAGLPVACTPTQAQLDLAPALADAAVRLDLDNPPADAARLDALLGDPQRLAQARAHAWSLGQSRFNWQVEQTTLLAALSPLLPSSS